jgi:hypothetical protein
VCKTFSLLQSKKQSGNSGKNARKCKGIDHVRLI